MKPLEILLLKRIFKEMWYLKKIGLNKLSKVIILTVGKI